MTATTLEVRTSPARIVGLASLCLAFVAAGAVMIGTGEGVVVGVLGIVFFGGAGGWAIVRLWRQRLLFTATAQGVGVVAGGFVPWADVERVDLGRVASARVLGLRLRSYDAYLGSLTPDQVRRMRRTARVGELAGWALAPLDADARALTELRPEDLVQHLAWARQQSGFELSWATSLIPHTDDVLARLQAMHVAAGGRGH